MADEDGGLLNIKVDADDYAETASADVPPVSRTYQSEADFQSQKAVYTAKTDGGQTYKDLMAAVPVLNQGNTDGTTPEHGQTKVNLSKKEVQLLGYAVGELYLHKDYARLVELCERVKASCEVDEKLESSLEKWMKQCHERMTSLANCDQGTSRQA